MALSATSFSMDSITKEVLFFYDVSVVDGSVCYVCRKCASKPKQIWKSGYSNLRKHLGACVGHGYMEQYERSKKETPNHLGFQREKYVSDKEFGVFRWLEWVILRDMPLSEVDNPLTRGISKLNKVSSKSLARYIAGMVPLVEAEIRKILPEYYGVMFDGWSDGSTHYIGVIATFMEEGKYREVLLGCSPPLNEKEYTADEHYALLKFVLSIYGKAVESPSVLIGDNCSTNRALANKMGIPLIGCGCHKLNLAVKAFLACHEDVVSTIRKIDRTVTQLRNLKTAGALRELTPLNPLKRNVTRWSSTHKMLERFLRIEAQVNQLEDVDVLRRTELESIRKVMGPLDKFRCIMTDLQKVDQHIGDVHGVFEGMTEGYPELEDYLAPDAAIVHSTLFEAAVVKIIDGKKDSLTAAERAVVKNFVVRRPAEQQIGTNTQKNYAQLLRERKKQRLELSDEYIDLRFIAGVSASAERLFSSAKRVLSTTRKRLTPVNFENILFLKHNRFLWSADTVSQAMKQGVQDRCGNDRGKEVPGDQDEEKEKYCNSIAVVLQTRPVLQYVLRPDVILQTRRDIAN